MPDTRTAVSEIVTGLGLYGFRDLAQALAARPRFITNVDDDVYDQLDEAFASGTHADVFRVAWANGQRFARSTDGLRGRPPGRWSGKAPTSHPPTSRSQPISGSITSIC